MSSLKLILLICASFVLSHVQALAATCSGSFDRYKPADLDLFLKQFDKENPGLTVHFFGLDGRDPVVLEGNLYAKPQRWREEVISGALSKYGSDIPPSRYGFLISSNANRLIMMHAQDAVAQSVLATIDDLENKTGRSFREMPIKVWALHIANVSDRPVLLVGCAMTEDPIILNSPEAAVQLAQATALRQIANGAKIVLYAPYWSKPENPTPMPAANDDCDQLISSSGEALSAHFIEDGQFKTHELWGASATEETKKSWLRYINPTVGNLKQDQLISTQKEKETLIVIVKGANGKARKMAITAVGSDQFIVSDFGPANPTPEELRDFEKSKNLGLYPPRKALACSKESYQKHMQKRANLQSARAMPQDALTFVLDKKWSPGLSCSRATAFAVYSRQFAAGRAMLADNKLETPPANLATHSFKRIDASSFELSATIRADKTMLDLLKSRDVNLVSGQVSSVIKMIDPERIEVKSNLKMANLVTAAEQGKLVYETKTENQIMNLCE